jgi:CBS domain-containing protein
MEDIFVGQVMSSGIVTVTRDTPVEVAAERLLERNIGSLVVVDDDNHLEGILTNTDFVRVVRDGDPNDKTTVGKHMTEDVITVTAQDSIRVAADRIINCDFHHLPVVDDVEGVIGMLSTTDLTAYVSDVEQPSSA